MRTLLLLLCATSWAAGQEPLRHRLTFSGGWSQQLQNSSFNKETATGLGLSYGFRAMRFLEFEAGMFTQLQSAPDLCSQFGCFDPNDLYVRIPFGFRLVAPLGRWELSAGGGGLWTKYWVRNAGLNPFNVFSRSGWGEYAVAGVAVSLDRNRHWWLGFSPKFFLSNPPDVRDRWMFLAGEVSWRF